jgi:outer membrane protein OmpA-like peptidoglycan-associated protein
MQALTSKVRSAAFGLALAGSLALPALACGDPGDERGEGSKAADAGAVAGITVGALLGGPIGAVVGGGAGALLGDRYHRQAKKSDALTQDLGASEAERARLAQDLPQRSGSLAEAQARGEQLGATLQRTDQVGLDVGFRTNDDGIAVQSMTPLLKLGALVAAMPQARIRIAGYADPRGSDAYNDELSLRRAQSVAAVLSSAGVPSERIAIEAHGKAESTSTAGDLDAYALDRRVTVRVELQGAGQVASRD